MPIYRGAGDACPFAASRKPELPAATSDLRAYPSDRSLSSRSQVCRQEADARILRESAKGLERRPLQQTATGRLPLCPVGDQGRVAAQYVATGQERKSHCSIRDAGSRVTFDHELPTRRAAILQNQGQRQCLRASKLHFIYLDFACAISRASDKGSPHFL